VLGWWRPAAVGGGDVGGGAALHHFARVGATLHSAPPLVPDPRPERSRGGLAPALPAAGGVGGAAPAPSSASPIALVVSLLGGSSAPLLHHYRHQLALQLLALPQGSFDTAGPDRVFELLKVRLGEADEAVADAAVMLRDVTESKRVSRDVAEAQVEARGRAKAAAAAAGGVAEPPEEPVAATADVLVTSSHYWPPMTKDKVRAWQEGA